MWYKDLKVGDKVFYRDNRLNTLKLLTVSKLTKTQVKFVDVKGKDFYIKMKRDAGCVIGSTSWYNGFFDEFTEENIKAYNHQNITIKAKKMMNEIESIIPDMEYDKLKELINTLNEFTGN